jgi:hypothetical protein
VSLAHVVWFGLPTVLLGWAWHAWLRTQPVQPKWRASTLFAGLVTISLNTVLVWLFFPLLSWLWRPNRDPLIALNALLLTGFGLSLLSLLFSLLGKGRGRWTILLHGVSSLVIWFFILGSFD